MKIIKQNNKYKYSQGNNESVCSNPFIPRSMSIIHIYTWQKVKQHTLTDTDRRTDRREGDPRDSVVSGRIEPNIATQTLITNSLVEIVINILQNSFFRRSFTNSRELFIIFFFLVLFIILNNEICWLFLYFTFCWYSTKYFFHLSVSVSSNFSQAFFVLFY